MKILHHSCSGFLKIIEKIMTDLTQTFLLFHSFCRGGNQIVTCGFLFNQTPAFFEVKNDIISIIVITDAVSPGGVDLIHGLLSDVPQMRQILAGAMGLEASRVSVKATTEEGLGFSGQGLGIAAQAVALIEEN